MKKSRPKAAATLVSVHPRELLPLVPAKAGTQGPRSVALDSRFRGNERSELLLLEFTHAKTAPGVSGLQNPHDEVADAGGRHVLVRGAAAARLDRDAGAGGVDRDAGGGGIERNAGGARL